MEVAVDVGASGASGVVRGSGTKPVIAFFAEVAPYPRPLFGGQIRIDRIIRQLLREFDVALVCQTPVSEEELASKWDLGPRLARIVTAPRRPIPEAAHPEWGSLVSSARAALRAAVPTARPASHDVVWSDELVMKARRLFEELPVAGVWASRTWMAEMARAAGARRVLVDVGDFEGRLMLERVSRSPFYRRKPLHWLQARQLNRYERRLPAKFDAISTCKTEDLDHLAKSGRGRFFVVPNGIDTPPTVPPRAPRALELLFVGALWYEPNAEALRWFVSEVHAALRDILPGVSLTVAGQGPISEDLAGLLSRAGVELHVSPESLAELYARASVSVAPLFTGGGTSIKVLESLAFGVPTVASPVAVRGLALEPGTHVEVAGSRQEFIAACAGLLRDSEKSRALAEAGRLEVARRFSWDTIGGVAREAIWTLLKSSGTRAHRA